MEEAKLFHKYVFLVLLILFVAWVLIGCTPPANISMCSKVCNEQRTTMKSVNSTDCICSEKICDDKPKEF